MVLKVGDILGLEDWGSRYRITNITETKIAYVAYYKNTRPRECIISRASFESVKWRLATLKWY